MSKTKTDWVCQSCGGVHAKFTGRCSHCQEWNSVVETIREPAATAVRHQTWTGESSKMQDLSDVGGTEGPRSSTGLPELDRVLGGGLVHASVVLLGGDPGIGKSTLLLQACASMAANGKKIVYASGEESGTQVSLRAKRLEVPMGGIKFIAESNLEKLIQEADKVKPDVLLIDSVQTAFTSQLQSGPGSVAQVREVATLLTRYGKSNGISIILVGHVTKEGTIAGPRVLEHIVDTVLSFEGEPGSSFRMLRAVKNRFGPANELGVFAMGDKGLETVDNPSSMFLTTHDAPVAGSCVLAALEGTRPFLVEVQALLEDSENPNPKRFAVGADVNKLQMLLAVLNKHAGMSAVDQNVYVKVVGGVRVGEPAMDLALLLAVQSSLRSKPLPAGLIVFGEVGLAGELRPVVDGESRLKEAAKLGFKSAVIPLANKPKKEIPGMEVIAVNRLDKAFAAVRQLQQAE